MAPPALMALALTLPKDLSPSFRDVSMELRCEVLTAFVRNLTREHMPQHELTDVGCGEGNGLGGPRYSLDFKLQKGKQDSPGLSLRVDFAFRGDGWSVARLCDPGTAPLRCFDKPESVWPLYPTVAAWLQAKPTKLQIFGMGYEDFLQTMLSYKGRYPLGGADAAASVRFMLRPTSSANLREGRVSFQPPVAHSLLECLSCPDLKCLNEQVVYRFEDRYLSLTRTTPEKVFTSGWVIDGPTPLAVGNSRWKYVCGASRYSLQTLEF